MSELLLFTDGSVNPKLKIGYGACLLVYQIDLPEDNLKSQVKVKKLEHTSSTRLELQTLLWGLRNI